MNRWYHSGGRHQSGPARGVPAIILLTTTFEKLSLPFQNADGG
jgi:hypothetical protein